MNDYWKGYATKMIDYCIVLLKTEKIEEEKKIQKKYNSVNFSDSDDDL